MEHFVLLHFAYVHAKGKGDRRDAHGIFKISRHLFASSLDFGAMWTPDDVPGIFSGEFKLPDLM